MRVPTYVAFWITSLLVALGLPHAAVAEQIRVSEIGETATCRDVAGNRITPKLRPQPSFLATKLGDLRIITMIDGKSCYFNANEYTVEGAETATCSSARSQSGGDQYAGTRGEQKKSCSR